MLCREPGQCLLLCLTLLLLLRLLLPLLLLLLVVVWVVIMGWCSGVHRSCLLHIYSHTYIFIFIYIYIYVYIYLFPICTYLFVQVYSVLGGGCCVRREDVHPNKPTYLHGIEKITCTPIGKGLLLSGWMSREEVINIIHTQQVQTQVCKNNNRFHRVTHPGPPSIIHIHINADANACSYPITPSTDY